MKKLRNIAVFALALQAPSAAFAGIVIPPDSEVIRPIQGGAARTLLPRAIRLLDWNVKKGEQGEPLTRDLPDFAKDRNLITIQEGHDTPFLKGIFATIPGFSFYMTSSFVFRGSMTGVVTGSAVEPERMDFRRSPGREPVFPSPKMTGLAYFEMEGGQVLLLANLHALNFGSPEVFEAQIKDAMGVIASHEGPVVLAGDFNTWTGERTKILMKETSAVGLAEVPFKRSGNGQAPDLDHVFQKGCVVEKAWVVENVKSSDHDPLFVDLNCGTP